MGARRRGHHKLCRQIRGWTRQGQSGQAGRGRRGAQRFYPSFTSHSHPHTPCPQQLRQPTSSPGPRGQGSGAQVPSLPLTGGLGAGVMQQYSQALGLDWLCVSLVTAHSGTRAPPARDARTLVRMLSGAGSVLRWEHQLGQGRPPHPHSTRGLFTQAAVRWDRKTDPQRDHRGSAALPSWERCRSSRPKRAL